MPSQTGRMTAKERTFIDKRVALGDDVAAAQAAGYAYPHQAAKQLNERPAIAAEVRKREAERITNDLLPLAVDRVERILRDDKAEMRHVLTAAKMVWDRSLGAEAGALQKEPHEMTADELAERVAQLRQRQAEIAGEARDVTPETIEGQELEQGPEPGAFG